MGRISDLLRKQYGLPEQFNEPVHEKPKDEEQEKKIKDYYENLFKEKTYENLNSKRVYELFQESYEKINGRKYDTTFNTQQLYDIIYYFSRSDRFLTEKRRSFSKGLMLFGSYGLGKTSIMRAMREIKHPQLTFGIKSALDIVQMYDSKGTDGVTYYNTTDKFFFDDLGTESTAKYYGKEVEVFREILEKRHSNKLLTHVSTNLDSEQIRIKYGDRVYSRMNEMFNFIVFEGEDYRKSL